MVNCYSSLPIIILSIFTLKLVPLESKVDRPPSRHLITTLEDHTAPVQGKIF
jgi:hypothetical protein